MRNLALIFVVGLIAAGSFFALKEKEETLCYIWNTEAGDSASLRLTITPDNKASGYFDFQPFEKDRKSGDFTGEIVEGMMRGWWEARAEGMQLTEEFFIQLGVGTASPGFGEMIGENTILYYANPEAVSYTPTLQQTDCMDEALN